MVVRGEVEGGTHCGIKKQQRGIFWKPWWRRRKKGVGGDRERESFSVNQGVVGA